MVVKRRLLVSVASALALVLTAAAPMVAATREAQPSPLRAATLLRLKDMVANGNTSGGAVVAVGYQEASKPGQLYLAFSTDGGRDYRRKNGNLRRFPVVGVPQLGLSLAVCKGQIWAASGYHASSDQAGDSDVFLTSRTITGGGAQALLTSTAANRKVRDVTVACLGNEYLAIGWLQTAGTKTTAQLMIRSMDKLGTVPTFKQVYNLGAAEYKSGLSVAATPTSAAVTFVRNGDLQLKRFEVSPTPAAITAHPLQTIAWNDVKWPQLAARGKRLAVTYSDAGKVRLKTSTNLGETLSSPRTLARTGSIANPSKPWSLDLVGDQMVATAAVWSKATGVVTPQLFTSSTFGEEWSTKSFGNVGTRMASLLKKKGQPPLLVESWHNNAPKGLADTLRARYEVR